jgi:NAD(P)-dependent dehydrogenase (short-subunit alcohol dehydrogenase family)
MHRSFAAGQFDGKRVLVTGGSMGIGLEVSQELARRGARVLVAARTGDAVDGAVAALAGSGHEGHRLDVSDVGAWPAVLESIDRSGPLDGLVAAAGVLGPIGPLDEVVPEQLVQALSVNLTGTMLALHHAIPRLRESGGRAVTFSGGGATSPLPRYDAYAASKAAVVRLTENVSADGDVAVNAVAPGFVATRMHDWTLEAGEDAAGADYFKRTKAQLAAGGFPAREAAELVCFLLSDDADGISGRLLSAQWDPWRDEGFRARLRAQPALGTLRRIDDQLFGAVPESVSR